MLFLDFFQTLSNIYIKPAKSLVICQRLYSIGKSGAVYQANLMKGAKGMNSFALYLI